MKKKLCFAQPAFHLQSGMISDSEIFKYQHHLLCVFSRVGLAGNPTTFDLIFKTIIK